MTTDVPLTLPPGVTNRGLLAAAMLVSLTLVGGLIGGLALISHALPDEKPQLRYQLSSGSDDQFWQRSWANKPTASSPLPVLPRKACSPLQALQTVGPGHVGLSGTRWNSPSISFDFEGH